jgi:hypothetical protein
MRHDPHAPGPQLENPGVWGRAWASHFHVGTPDAAAVIAIETLVVLSGAVDAKTLAEARAWADAHRAALSVEWFRLNPEKDR